MPRRWLAMVVVVSVLIATFAWPRTVSACSCAMPGTPAQAFSLSDGVFVGQVTGIGEAVPAFIAPLVYELARSVPGLQPPYGRVISFQVTDSWKGVTTTAVTVRTGYGDADCGYKFSVGQMYLVYAHQGGYPDLNSREWSANICSRTAEISAAAADLLYLQPLPKLTLTPAPTSLWSLACAGAALLLFAGLSGAFWLRRRRDALRSVAS